MHWSSSVKEDIVWGGSPYYLEMDGLNPRDLTKVEIEGRRAVIKGLDYLRNNMPGMENAYLIDTSSQIGVRETRRIIGNYILTKQDEISGKRFEDSIVSSLFDIPYRCLIPKKVDNLVVGGRCISTTHEAQGAIRNIPPCMITGQAGGIAAAIAVKKNIKLSKIDSNEIKSFY